MAHFQTPEKATSVNCSSFIIFSQSSGTSGSSITTDPFVSPRASHAIELHSKPVTAIADSPVLTYSACQDATLPLMRCRPSPNKANMRSHDAKIEMANVKIAELRQANSLFKISISELQNERDNAKLSAEATLADKDDEIKILKSNAWLDDVALRQKDEEIAALRRCIEASSGVVHNGGNETAIKIQKLNLTIIDLSLVKKELMEEICELEIKKEELEFS